MNTQCTEIFVALGIIHQKSCDYTPQQNEIAERKHRHILEVTRALRFQAGIPIKYCGLCAKAAVYLINRLPSYVLKNKTQYELLYNKKPSVLHLRIISCLCFAKDVQKSDKLKSRARTAILMGYTETQKGYLLYDLTSHVFFVNRDVFFREDIFPFNLKIEKSTSIFNFTGLNEPMDNTEPDHRLMETQTAHDEQMQPPTPDVHAFDSTVAPIAV